MSTAAATSPDFSPPDLSQIVDLTHYPIDQPDHALTRALVERCRAQLDETGCALIKDFMQPQSVQRMRAESERLYPRTYWTKNTHNPYFSKDDDSLPLDHPKRFFQERHSGYIDSDILEADSDLRAIYTSDTFLQFISTCLGVSPLYCWADPLGCNPYGVMDEQHYFPWHFDGNDFTVSILVQEAEAGGIFEYAPDLRHRNDENFVGVQKVLQGGREGVHELDLRPGDLQIFKGRFSLHRVTPIRGARRRVVALPSYVTNPYSVNRLEHSLSVYGRAMPIHYERGAQRPDALAD